MGTITYNGSAAGFSPWLRHRYQLATTAGVQIMATGVRLLVPSSGLATGTDIDELELFRSSVTNIAYWRMGENDSGAADGVTNIATTNLLGGVLSLQSNAVYSSSVATTAAAQVGSSLALQFTTGRYATNALATTLTDNFGLELWVKPDATNAIQCVAYNGNSGPNGWGLYLYQGKYQGLIGGQAFLPGPDAVPGVWTHLALVRNNGLTTLYVNGLPAVTSALPPNTPTGRFALAAQAQTLTAEFFAGALDEVRVFTFAPGTFSTGDLLLPVLPPTVTTTAATSVGGSSATLNGTVNPRNLAAAAWFEWGTTTNYGNFTATNLLATTNVVQALSNNLTGLVGGTTYHYRLAASNALGFSYGADQAFTTDNFSPVSLPGVPATDGEVAWGDYDNDGRLDFLIMRSSSSQLWRNTGNGFTNVPVPGLPGGGIYARMASGDFNNDGNLDFFLIGDFLAQIWKNNGDNTFSNVTASLAPGLTGGFKCNAAWGDYDNDGRLDFLFAGREIGNKMQLWRNTGQGFTNVTASVAPGVPGLTSSSLAWADYDNDGRLDFVIAGQYTPDPVNIPEVSVLQLWHNTGNGFELAPPLPVPQLSSSPHLAWGDFDNDGRLDLAYTGSEYYIPTYLFRNTGNGFQLAGTLPVGERASARSTATWGDYDNDGRLDLLVLSWMYTPDYSAQLPIAQLWRNTTNGFVTVPFSSSISTLPSKAAWGDYDNDGRLDLIWVGDVDNPSIQLWHNNTPQTNTPPSAPTGLAMTATTNAVMLSWNSATDGQTPATGLTYNVRAGSTPGGIDLFAGHVNATNGFRRVPAMGNAYLRHSLPITGLTNGQTVYWSVQAVDTSFAGGPFASETNFYSAIVTTTADSGAGSLRAAVTNVATPKLVTFAPALSGQTITLTSGQLTLANTVTIDGSALASGIQINGNASSRIFNVLFDSTVVLDSLTLTNGRAVGDSGAAILNGGNLTVTRCTLVGNSADFYGGGIATTAGQLTVNECTLTGNQCSFNGAAAIDNVGSTVTVLHSTVTGNTAFNGAGCGGIGNYSAATVTLYNSIVAGNISLGSATNLDQTITFTGVNLTNGVPLLAPLGHYGGPTPTMPPLPGSPALNAATNGTIFTTDQRGKPRIVGTFADLGAVEGVFNPNYPIVNFTQLSTGNVRFNFTNLSGPSYRVLATTNVAAPINTWTDLGAPIEAPASSFTFTDLQATNYPSRFYRVTMP